LSLGVLAFAGLSVGIWAFGGLALGVFAFGGAAIAVWAAYGGLAVAREYSVGGLAIGSNSNTEVARLYFESSAFFSVAVKAARYSRYLLVLAIIVPIATTLMRRQEGRQS
jgi:hypothetical protein